MGGLDPTLEVFAWSLLISMMLTSQLGLVPGTVLLAFLVYLGKITR